MKILMMDKYLTVGGVATFLKILSKQLMADGHSVWLVTAADKDNKEIIRQFASYGIQVITIPVARNRTVTGFRFFNCVRQLLKNNDVDLIHSHHRLANFAGMLISKVYNIPHLLTLHVFKDDFKFLIKWWRNEQITVPSLALKKHLLNHYELSEKRITVIYNTLNPGYKVDAGRLNTLQKTLFKDNEAFYVCYIGRISHEKGIDTILESIPLVKQENPHVRFRIFGPGPQLPALKKRCRELNLDADQIFMGFHTDVNEILHEADLCVAPSRSESFSLFALECLRAGKPIIATNVGGIPEVVTHQKTGLLIEPDDPESLAENILVLCSDEEMRKEFAENSQKSFKEKFSIETFYRSYKSAYQYLIS